MRNQIEKSETSDKDLKRKHLARSDWAKDHHFWTNKCGEPKRSKQHFTDLKLKLKICRER